MKKSGNIPNVKLKIRIRTKSKKENPFMWKTVKTHDLFKNKKVVIFSLPGAFTPICSASHLPGYEKEYNKFKKHGIDEIYCVSVNDPFVMFQWGKKMGIKNVKMLPDGCGIFTKKMDALVKKDNLGFGNRSWRYSMLIDNNKIVKVFSEKGQSNNCKTDPFKVSDASTMLNYLKE